MEPSDYANNDDISHLLLFQVMSEIHSYELDEKLTLLEQEKTFPTDCIVKKTSQIFGNQWHLSFVPCLSCS